MKNVIVGLVLLVGCADTELATSSGNAELGIASFTVQDTDYKTTVTGLDASGAVVGRFELVHGLFTLSSMFAEDYATPQIVGRKLDVDVRGEQMTWETGGFEPVMHLPPHPDFESSLPVFLEDPHVKVVLERWGIGFADTASAETPYTVVTGSSYGDSPQTCDNASSCGTAYYGTVNLCNGGSTSIQARRVTQHAGSNCGLYSSSYNQIAVEQCCPPDYVNTITTWFARKACPTTSNNATECGTRTAGACKGCPGYPALNRSCSITTGATVGTCGSAVYPISYTYESCHTYGESCSTNRDCCTDDPMFCDSTKHCNYY